MAPEFAQLGLTALVLYLIGLVVVAEVARRHKGDHTPADHFLAGRGLGPFVLFLTLYATAYSGNSLLGYPGEAYRRGFSWIMATGFMAAIIVGFHALAPKLYPLARTHGFVTPGDWIRHRFAGEARLDALRIAVGIAMSLALVNFLLAQLIAMGHVTHQITAGAVPHWVAVVGLAGLILGYETLGGMRAVAWTDAAQGIIMLIGLGALANWLLGSGGGLAELTRAIREVRPDAVALPDARECANWMSSIVLMGVASVIYPQAIQRIFAARDGRALRTSFALMSFMPLATTTVVTLIGLAAIPRLAGLEGVEADTVMPRLLGEWAASGPTSALAAVVVFIGALAAIMSTADSCLLSLGSIVAGDVLGRDRSDAATTTLGKRIAAASMIVLVILALSPKLTLWKLIVLKMELLIQCAPAFLLALHWKRFRADAALAGLIGGAIVAFAGVAFGLKKPMGIHIGVIGLAVNLMIAYAGTLTLGRTTPPSD